MRAARAAALIYYSAAVAASRLPPPPLGWPDPCTPPAAHHCSLHPSLPVQVPPVHCVRGGDRRRELCQLPRHCSQPVCEVRGGALHTVSKGRGGGLSQAGALC